MNIKSFMAIIGISMLLTSCLKSDDPTGLLEDKGSIIIDIPEVSYNNYHGSDQMAAFYQTPSVENVHFFTLRAYSPRDNKPANNVTVKLTASSVTGYEPLPAGSIPANLEFIIPKDSGFVNVNIPVTKTNLDPAKSYAATFKITSVSEGVASDLGKEITVYVTVKNNYDGVYSVESGSTQRYSAPGVPTVGDALNGSIVGNPNVSLVTINATTVEIQGLQWASKGGAVAGINNLRATVDPATNQVTLVALGNTTLANWVGKENKYDPTTKTFTINFRWNPVTTPREYSAVIKFKESR